MPPICINPEKPKAPEDIPVVSLANYQLRQITDTSAEYLELSRRLDVISEALDSNLKYTKALCRKSKLSLGPLASTPDLRMQSPECISGAPTDFGTEGFHLESKRDRRLKRQRILTKELVCALSRNKDGENSTTFSTFNTARSPTTSGSALSGVDEIDGDKAMMGTSTLLAENLAQLTKMVMERNSLRQQRATMIWRFLEDSNSSRSALVYFRARCIFIALSVAIACVQVVESSKFVRSEGHVDTTYIQLAVEVSFAIELAVVFIVCPNREVFWQNLYNVIDLMSVLPCFLRLSVIIASELENAVTVVSLVGLVPVIRLLKVLRHFETFQLLLSAFRVAIEAMPMLLFNVCLIIASLGAVIYFCEPRTNIESLPMSFYLATVTLSTVGYGDVTAETTSGRMWICFLAVLGPMYMAIPLGIIGNAFNDVWEDRHRLLLLQRMRNRVMNSGYTPRDLKHMFKLLDQNSDGTLDYEEFVCFIEIMQVNADDEFLRQVFANFDADHHGAVDFHEFLYGLFPHTGKILEQSVSKDTVYDSDVAEHGP